MRLPSPAIAHADGGEDLRARLRSIEGELQSSEPDRWGDLVEERQRVEDELRHRFRLVRSGDQARAVPARASRRPTLIVNPTGDRSFDVLFADGTGVDRSTARIEKDVASLRESLDHAFRVQARSGTSSAGLGAAAAVIDDVGACLGALLPAGSRPERIIASGPLAVFPWRVLHELRDAPFEGVLPGLQPGDDSEPSVGAATVLVGGPDLAHGPTEIQAIRAAMPTSRTMLGDEATIHRVMAALAQADVAHFACHGSFRRDSPYFSCLHLADGPATAFDFASCPGLPSTIVLSACDVGRVGLLGKGSAVGLAGVLVQLGVRSVIAPLSVVNDERSVDLMVRLHTHLAAGAEPAAALAAASTLPDGSLDPTATPFVCFGS
ncbi:MAG: CHAT domain-containing protein [Actinomycetota bacterium]